MDYEEQGLRNLWLRLEEEKTKNSLKDIIVSKISCIKRNGIFKKEFYFNEIEQDSVVFCFEDIFHMASLCKFSGQIPEKIITRGKIIYARFIIKEDCNPMDYLARECFAEKITLGEQASMKLIR